jgi:hypothetical protein
MTSWSFTIHEEGSNKNELRGLHSE